jgi:hypothetical protein
MNITKHFTRFAILALICVLSAGATLAGDDEKDKGKPSKEDKVQKSKLDSLDVDLDIEISESDDTLVFEDWDAPIDNGGGNGISSIFIPNDVPSKKPSSGDALSFMLSDNKFSSYLVEKLAHTNNYVKNFSIYPNPSTEIINLTVEKEPITIRICDITGKEHISLAYSQQVHVSHLPIGTYFMQLIYTDHIESSKFIKQ